MLFMLLFLGVIFYYLFYTWFRLLVAFLYSPSCPYAVSVIGLWLLHRHINNKELNRIIIPYHTDAGYLQLYT
jgi:hypothetical protein